MRKESLYYTDRNYYPPRALPIDAPLVETWKDITLLTDVNSIYIFENKEKKFFFFGDQHFAKSAGGCEEKLNIKCDDYNGNFTDSRYYGSACTSIGILLHNWFLYNNDNKIKTDFYLELAFTKDEERQSLQKYIDMINDAKRYRRAEDKNFDFDDVSWLELIAAVMNDCFTRKKEKCVYYPNVRAHYADIRRLDDKEISIHTDPFLLYDISSHLREAFMRIKTEEQLLDLKDELSIIISIIIFDYKKILNGMLNPVGFDKFIDTYIELGKTFAGRLGEFYFDKFVNMKRISVIRKGVRMHRAAAELARLREETPFMATLIEEFIYEKAEHYIKSIQHFFDEIMDMFKENFSFVQLGELIVELFEALIKALVPMSALSMDCYLLSRMFLQNDSKEIIVYAGSQHIEHYADFFENYLGIKRLAGVESEIDNRCLSMIDLPKYLDANKYRAYAVNKKYKAYLDWLQRY